MIALADTVEQRGAGRHKALGPWRGLALFSPCGLFRYYLDRVFDPLLGEEPRPDPMVFLMLNPSIADAFKGDRTVDRCCSIARADGFQRVVVLNLYAFRAMYPADMEAAADPIGVLNDAAIFGVLELLRTRRRTPGPGGAPLDPSVVCAWGASPFARARGRQVVRRVLDTLGPYAIDVMTVCGDGSPGHPLDRRAGLTREDRRPRVWAGATDYAAQETP